MSFGGAKLVPSSKLKRPIYTQLEPRQAHSAWLVCSFIEFNCVLIT
jgi:hypothetical protein